jgi:hypothetical protein
MTPIKKKTEIKLNWARKIVLDLIIKSFDDFIIEEKPFDKKNRIRTFIFTRKEEDYENIE